ncbi:MlaA family lipoprotein [Alteromonas gilva]|uniref:VacJ family lipoprotein n=1 Tax=Alteromonas gilva TaxID=2987522 RepID=A0ABT5L4A4_9ALTE|nr:VacJ family lipoprotein [Alteromonas gilva]MDC8830692.1 VacJ family lipoprotein [Alteromonas gilva]
MNYKSTLLTFLLFVVAGCSSIPPPDQVSPVSVSTARAPGEAQQGVSDKAEQLSQGKPVSIATSQGQIDIEPAVVAVANANSATDPVVPAQPDYYDPWEGFNRSVFAFNHKAYEYVLIPVTDGYKAVIPSPVRASVGNFFANLREPLNLLNNLFSGDVDDAGSNLGRFLINSTVGVLGLFDPASSWFDIDKKRRSIGDMLAHYGVGSGPFLVLPVLGQSDVRGGVSILTEGIIHPVNQIADSPQNYQLRTVDGLDDFSSQSDTYQTLYNEAQDPYLYFRNQYLQGQARDTLYENKNAKD